MITVQFYGLCLFEWEKDQVRVLLPQTNADSFPRKLHYAYLLDRNRTGDPVVIAEFMLDTTRIEFDNAGARPTRGDTTDLIRLNKVQSDLEVRDSKDLYDNRIIVGEVILRGGTLDATAHAPSGRNAYYFPATNYELDAPVCEMTWTLEGADEIEVTLKDAEGHVTATYQHDSRDHRLVIGNVCEPDPMNWECTSVGCPIGTEVPDDDFAWYYNLFSNPNPDLPVPFARCNDIMEARLIEPSRGEAATVRTATTSTCYNGEHCTPPDEPC